MSNDAILQKIQRNPKYKQLVKSRSSYAMFLTVIMLIIYFSFILTIAFYPSILGIRFNQRDMTVVADDSITEIVEGNTTTIGIPVGILVILSAFGLTGLYVRRANGEFDALTKQLIEESK